MSVIIEAATVKGWFGLGFEEGRFKGVGTRYRCRGLVLFGGWQKVGLVWGGGGIGSV